MSEIPTVRLVNRVDPDDFIVVNLADEHLYVDRYCRREQLDRERAELASPEPEVTPEVTPEDTEPPADQTAAGPPRRRRQRF